MWSRSRLHDDDDRTVTAGQAGGCWGGRVHGQYRPGTQSRALTRVPHTTSTDWLMEGDLWSQLTGGPIIQTWLISWSEQRKISEKSTTWSCRRVCARDYRHVWGLFSEGVGHVTCNQDTHTLGLSWLVVLHFDRMQLLSQISHLEVWRESVTWK